MSWTSGSSTRSMLYEDQRERDGIDPCRRESGGGERETCLLHRCCHQASSSSPSSSLSTAPPSPSLSRAAPLRLPFARPSTPLLRKTCHEPREVARVWTLRIARFGSVKPFFLNPLPYDEFWYLFKTLAFGSDDPAQHPHLVRIAEEFAEELQSGGSLIAANAYADVLRRNLNVQFWLCVLNRQRRVIQKNLSVHGVPPNLRFHQGHSIDITDFALQMI
ncbi:hypothetical protein BRADI_1g34375v3 [Brachypodium distachyon]|uniref:Uncharacterized protein n=1 Tax=Brachypodium distachyon TaxID=15368 RepID=A0A0Q3H3H2_BRADI|nr:hypothetical protein BRADI_1g34375v3 [Brachypodium distachyon]